MIISQEQEVVFGSANQQATAFGIENNAKAFILLSDKLYTNKPYAIVRELSTNCLDAHKLNGQTRPFEVKVPTRLDPRFVIRDFGPGYLMFRFVELMVSLGCITLISLQQSLIQMILSVQWVLVLNLHLVTQKHSQSFHVMMVAKWVTLRS